MADTSATSTDTGISSDVGTLLESGTTASDHLRPTMSIAERKAYLTQSQRDGATVTAAAANSLLLGAEELPKLSNSPFVRKDTRRLQLQKVAAELLQTEQSYMNTIKLLDVELRDFIGELLPPEQVQQLLDPFTPLRQLSAHFVDQFGACLKDWKQKPKIAHVLVKFGPFLKQYGEYGSKFDSIKTLLDSLENKNAGKLHFVLCIQTILTE